MLASATHAVVSSGTDTLYIFGGFDFSAPVSERKFSSPSDDLELRQIQDRNLRIALDAVFRVRRRIADLGSLQSEMPEFPPDTGSDYDALVTSSESATRFIGTG